MNLDQLKIYRNLMNLTEITDRKFFFVDRQDPSTGQNMRIFSYHYASYNDWLLNEDALKSRGIMFSMDKNWEPIELVCYPMDKFFNYQECPFTMDLDLEGSGSAIVMDKLDGSLISTYSITADGKRAWAMKSKTSMDSTQARRANKIVQEGRFSKLRTFINAMESSNCTVNLEYTSPNNRIVLPYQIEDLRILNVRSRNTGMLLTKELFSEEYQHLFVDTKIVPSDNLRDFVESVKDMTGIEGYVVAMNGGQGLWFKLKTKWYCELHKTKDSINNNKSLFQNIVDENADDLRSMFSDDAVSISKINTFSNVFVEEFLIPNMRKLETLRSNYGDLVDRESKKQYALDCKKVFETYQYPWLFAVAMNIATEDRNNEEDLVKLLGDAFMRNYEQFVPLEYKTEEEIE